jgi:hypothetical protein
MIHVAPCAFFVSEGLHERPGPMREYSLPIIHLVINDLSLSLYRMLAELYNTKNSRYFDGKRVLNDGIHTSMVTVYKYRLPHTHKYAMAAKDEWNPLRIIYKDPVRKPLEDRYSYQTTSCVQREKEKEGEQGVGVIDGTYLSYLATTIYMWLEQDANPNRRYF